MSNQLCASGAAPHPPRRQASASTSPTRGEAVWLLALWTFLALACSPTPAETVVQVDARTKGQALFSSSAFSPSSINTWSCATCHAVTDNDDRMLSGHDLRGVTQRARTWGGAQRDLLTAVNFCLVYFMRGDPISADNLQGRALYEYLHSLPGPLETLPFTVVKNAAEVPRGDATRGQQVYQRACLECHGETGTGAGSNNPRISSILPNVQEDYAELFPGVAPSLVFIEKIRHGQFFGVGGNMPLFSLETLSDEDLGALLAYLEL